MKVLLTGFGTFSGVETNPTETIINNLIAEQWKPDDIEYENFSLKVVEVSSIACDSVIDSYSINNDQHVLIHLGVDSNSTSYKLETTAYNNMTFRVPDEKGYQPNDQKIQLDQSFDEPFKTSLPIQAFNSTLQMAGYKVNPSEDPGRYICNYMYYKSLMLCNQQSNNNTCPNSTALFIHCPPIHICPIDNQCDFIKSVVNLIVQEKIQSLQSTPVEV